MAQTNEQTKGPDPQQSATLSAEAHLAAIADAERRDDLEGLKEARLALVTQHPGHEAVAEALYKLALERLFVARNLEEAITLLESAIRTRHSFWSPAARVSLGLCLLRQQRTQKALFELRKVAYVKEPSPHSLVALSFIEMVAQQAGQGEEMRLVRRERIAQLDKRIARVRADAQLASELPSLLVQLGQLYEDEGDGHKARPLLAEARASLGRGQTGEFDREVLRALSGEHTL